MKLVPLVIGGVALVAVAYGGYALLNPGPKAPSAQAPPARTAAAPQRPGARPGIPPAPVVVARVETAAVPVTLSVIGNVQASSTIAVKSQVDGQVSRVHFREGQMVKSGDLLFTIDPRSYEAALRQAEANLTRNKALLVKARADLARSAALVQKDFTSRSTYDQAVANVAALEAAIQADEASIIQAALRVEYTRITAPIDGRVGSILVNPGNLVRANDTNAQSSALVVLTQVRPIYVQFSVPESYLGEIRARMAAGSIRVRAAIPEDALPPAVGTLTFVNNVVDTTTGTVLLKATYPNEDDRLTPGQFVNVTVELAVIAEAVVVPPTAVQVGQRGHYVFVVKADNTVELRLVRAGIRTENAVVVEDGLRPGERVVTEGQLRLRPGARVVVRPSSGTPPGRATTPNGPPG